MGQKATSKIVPAAFVSFAISFASATAPGIPALGTEAIPLPNSVAVTGHVAAGGLDLTVPGSTIFYEVSIPAGTEVLEVRVIMQNGDADLLAGPIMSLNQSDYYFISDYSGLVTEGGGIDQGTNPPLGAYETWYFAVHGYDATDYFIIASWGSADPATPLLNGQSVSDQVELGVDILVFPQSTKYYWVDVGEGAEEISFSLTVQSGDADLLVGRVLNASPAFYDVNSDNPGTEAELIQLTGATIPMASAARIWYIAVHGWDKSEYTLTVTWRGQIQPGFLRGDCNRDFSVDISDPIAHVATIFSARSAPCLDACDSNGDGRSDLTDPVYTLQFLFLNGGSPPGPYPSCENPSPGSALGCDTPLSCGG